MSSSTPATSDELPLSFGDSVNGVVDPYRHVFTFALYVLLGSSSAFYTYIWRNPTRFMAFAGSWDPCVVS